MSEPTVIVVGGGVLGAGIAHALAQRSARVTLLDAATPGGGASAATFAWVNAHKKQPESYFRLNVEGMAQYHRMVQDGVGKSGVGKSWFHPVGNIGLATDAASSAELDKSVADLLARGYRAERITARQAADLEPMVDPDRIVDAAFFPDEGWVDTERMVADLLAGLTAAGGEIRTHCAVSGFEQTGSGVTVLLEDGGKGGGKVGGKDGGKGGGKGGGKLAADYVVSAVGAATQRLLAGSGVDVPLIAAGDVRARPDGEQRYVAVGGLAETAPLRVPLRRVLHISGMGLSGMRLSGMGLRPTPSGRVLLGGDGGGSQIPRTDPGFFGIGPTLLARARELFPALADVPVDRVRVGVRPMPADGRTVAGFTSAVAGLYVVVTHSGVTLAPYLADRVATEVLSGTEVPELAEFRPGRFRAVG